MIAVILAAGRGKRLHPYTIDVPKALLKLDLSDGKTVLDYQLETLRRFSVEKFCIVAGYKFDLMFSKVKHHSDILVVRNDIYYRTNSVYSAFLALKAVDADDIIIINSDVVFHASILEKMLSVNADAVVAIDSTSDLDEEAMKVKVVGNQVVLMSKNLDVSDSYGENVGIIRFRKESLSLLRNILCDIISSGFLELWFPEALNEFVKYKPLYYIDVKGLPWIEIDYPRDLEKARELYRCIRS